MKKLLLALLCLNSLSFALGVMPDGPWRGKCSNNDLKKSFSGGVMTAFCGPGYKDFFGGTSVSLNYDKECQANSLVDYVNEQLVCLSPKEGASILPGGTWLSTCNSSKATFSGGVLKAFCNNPGSVGGVNASLDYANNCKPNSLVKFSNGELMCDMGGSSSGGFNPNPNNGGFNPTPNNTDNLPSGSWISSCDVRGATMRGTILIADCKNNQGKYNSAALDLKSCGNNVSVSNSNGSLTCNSSQGFNPTPDNSYSDGLPSGSWRKYCDVSTGKMTNLGNFEAKCKSSPSGILFLTWFDYDNCDVGSGVNYDARKEEFYCVVKGKSRF